MRPSRRAGDVERFFGAARPLPLMNRDHTLSAILAFTFWEAR
jgi:hypothetical protein